MIGRPVWQKRVWVLLVSIIFLGFRGMGGQVASAYTLSASVSNTTQGYIIQSPQEDDYSAGTSITLYAGVRQGYQFAGWAGDVPVGQEQKNPLVITIGTNTTITATFRQISGKVCAWGLNTSGQCTIPEPNRDFAAVAAGPSHNLGLKTDGTIVAWGGNDNNQCVIPQPNRNFVRIAVGNTHSLGLKSDGTVVAWGDNTYGQCSIPAPNADFISILASQYFSAGLKKDGRIVKWGNFVYPISTDPGYLEIAGGRLCVLGLKSNGSISAWGGLPFDIGIVPEPNNDFVLISGGYDFNLALKKEGRIVGWGNSSYGQLNFGSDTGYVNVAGGWRHSLGLRSDSSIVARGANDEGQCNVPTPNIGFVSVSAGWEHSLAIASVGSLQVTLTPPDVVSAGAQWRLENEKSGVWHNSNDTVTTWTGTHAIVFKDIYGWAKPTNQIVQIDLDDVVSERRYTRTTWSLSTICNNGSIQEFLVGNSFEHGSTVTLTVQPDSGYWFDRWTGDVPFGQERLNPLVLRMDANKTIEANLTLVRPPAEPVITFFRINNGAATTANPNVTLSNVCSNSTTTTIAYYMASESSNFIDATWQTYASVPLFRLSSDGTTKTIYFKIKDSTNVESSVTSDTISLISGGLPVVNWGKNDASQCTIPSPNSGFLSVAVGWKHNVGLKSDGTIVTWGENNYNQIPVPSPNNGFVTVGAGTYHSLGIKSDGSVVAWGRNSEGQCDVPLPNSGFVAVAAGVYHSIGLKSDGSIVAWGSNNDTNGNYSGQSVVPSPNRGFVAVSAGEVHSQGLKADGSIVAWGTNKDWLGNDVGLCVVPSSNSGFVAIANGCYDNLALKSDGSIVTWGTNVDWERKNINLCVVPSPNSGFVAIASGPYHHLGLKSNGSITAWGRTTEGQCTVPRPNRGFSVLAGGGLYHSVALVSKGALQVTLSPSKVVTTGAQWRLVSETAGIWHNSGGTVTARIGPETLTFKDVYGWTKPVDQQVEFKTGETTMMTAHYVPVMWPLSATCTDGKILVSPSGSSFPHGTTVTLSVQPDPGYWFDHWMGDIPVGRERVNPLVLTMDSTKTLTANLVSGPPPAAPVITSFKINNGAATVVNPTVMLVNNCTAQTSGSAAQYLASESPDFSAATWQPYGSIPMFKLSEDTGNKTVYFKVKNSAGMESSVTSDTISLEGAGSIRAWGESNAGSSEFPNPELNGGFIAVSGGNGHSLGLKSDGSVVAWGNNSYGQCTVPTPNSSFVTVAAGGSHSLGLKSDGSIVAWGSNSSGQCTVPTSNSGFVAVAAGGSHSLGLKSDGSVVAWGSNSYGQRTVPTPNSGFVAVAAGGSHSLGLKSDGSVVAWGSNSYGQCTVPTSNSGFVAATAGASHSLGLRSDGSVVAWGSNSYGQCTVPTSNSGFVAVTAGGSHSLGLKSDGSIVAWGSNRSGQCSIPTPNSGFCALAGGGSHSLAIAFGSTLQVAIKPQGSVAAGAQWRLTNETVGVWHNSGTSLPLFAGRDYTVEYKMIAGWQEPTSQTVSIEKNKLILLTGEYRNIPTCSLTTSATHGYIVNSPIRPDYPVGSTVTLYAGARQGYQFTGWKGDVPVAQEMANPLILTMDTTKSLVARFEPVRSGIVLAWGDNSKGQCTVPPPLNKGFVALAAGYNHNLGLRSDGSILAWGDNGSGQCTVPAPNSGFIAIAARADHSLGLKSDGSVVAWGNNSYRQCMVPAPNSGFLAIATGATHSLGLKSDGSIVAWGDNSDGQCTVPSPNSGYVAIAAGASYSLGLKSDGSVVAWGENRYGECNVPTPDSGYVAIAAGTMHNLGLKPDGAVVAWGYNGYGQCTIPLPNSGFIAISAAYTHSMGLKSDGSIVAWGDNSSGQCTVPSPNNGYVAVAAGGTYQHSHSLAIAAEGVLQVTLSPAEAVAAGGQWRLKSEMNDGTWYDSGTSLSLSPDRSYTVEYKLIPGWLEPTSQTVIMGRGQSVSLTGLYQDVPTCSLTTSATHGYVVTSPLRPDYPVDSTVNLYAGAYQGYRFTGWVGDVPAGQETANPLLLTMDTTRSLVATFELAPRGIVQAWGDNEYGQCTIPSPDGNFVAIAGGNGHSLGLKSDGSIVAWGRNNTGQCSVPSPNSDFVAVAAGWFFSLGLKSNGSIVAWGDNSDGQCTVPSPNSGFIAISAGYGHSLGLRSDGSIVAWGYNGYGQCTIPSPNSGFVAIAGGNYHSLGLKSDGSIMAWGSDLFYDQTFAGQCDIPVHNRDFVAIAAGDYHSLGLKSDGSIVAWGYNGNGQCVVPSPNTGFVDLSAGYNHNLGLRSNGSIVAWGYKENGQCTVPSPNNNFIALAGGETHSLALTVEGTLQVTLNPAEAVLYGAQWRLTSEAAGVWHDSGTSLTLFARRDYTIEYKVLAGWQEPLSQTVRIGENELSTLVGVYQDVPTCSLVTSATHGYVIPSPARPDYPVGMPVTLFPQPYPGYRFIGWMGDVPVGQETVNPLSLTMDTTKTLIATFGVVPGRRIVAWGNNDFGQCTVPSSNSDFVSVAAGNYFSLGLKSDGSIVAWGMNWQKQCTVPSPNNGFVAIAAGHDHSLGLKSDGSIVAWGDNTYVPSPNSGFVAIAEGNYHSLGLKSDGSIVAWGLNDFGQCSIPSPNSDFVALAAGGYYSLGLKSDGSLVAWGKIGKNGVLVPVTLPAANTNYVAISAGSVCCLGLKSDGTIVVWGDGSMGQYTAPSPNSHFVSVAAGNLHNIGLKSDGSIVTWGDNTYGQCIVPSPNRCFVDAVAAGYYHSLALVLEDNLQVTLKPPKAASAGAQWRLQGDPPDVWHDSGASTPCFTGTYSVEFKEALGWIPPVAQTVTVQENKMTTATVTYRKGWILTTGAENGIVSKSPDHLAYAHGTTVTVTAIPDTGFHFDQWTLDFNPSSAMDLRSNPLVVTMDSTKTLTAMCVINEYPLTVEAQNGSVVKSPDQETYAHGTTVTLTATPAVGYRFTGWSGSVTSTANPLDVVMDSTKTLTANFAINEYALRVEVQNGSVARSPNQETYAHGTAVTLTATPGVGYRFTGWSGSTTSTLNPLVLTMDSTKTLVANFAINEYALAVEAQNGSVVKSPDQETYAHGTTVTLTATPEVGYHFRGWSGSTTSTLNSLVVTMDSTKTLVANFAINEYALTIEVQNGSVAKSPDQETYAHGTTVTLTATPEVGYHFRGWSGSTTSTLNSLVVTMDSTKTLVANFAINEYALTIEVQNGSVAKSPDQETYVHGTTVTLTATPGVGYHFTGWSGSTLSTANPLVVVMDSKTTLAANFAANQYTLTANVTPADSGIVALDPPGDVYEFGTTVTLTATPVEGKRFVSWTGDATGSNPQVTVTMNANKTVTANFENLGPTTLNLVADPVEAAQSLTKMPDLGHYDVGTTITVGVIPAYGYQFRGWVNGDTTVSTEASFVYTMPAMSETLVARFKTLLPDPSTIMVLADPVEGGTVSKTPDLTFYPQGTTVTLTAVPSAGYSFVGWYAGATQVTTSTSYVMMVGPETFKTAFTAKFRYDDQYTLTLVANPLSGGMVKKTPDWEYYEAGTTITLTATQADGYEFRGWMDGATTVSTNATYVYTVAENKTFTANFRVQTGPPTYNTLTVTATEGGSASKSPDQASYAAGAQVTLTATATTGYKFDGFYDGATLLSASSPYGYTMPAANKTLTAKFSKLGPDAPTGVTAAGNTYMVLVSWNAVEATTPTYVVERIVEGTTDTTSVAWAVDGTEFADDTAVPGVTYAYTVKTVDGLQNESAPSAPATAAVTAETVAAAAYKVTAKGYTMERDASNNLAFTGSAAGTIKIALLKKLSKSTADNPAKGIYYLLDLGQVPTLAINGDVKTLAFDVPVYSLEASGLVKAVSAKSVTFLKAREFGKVTITATKDSGAGLYARTFIETTSAGTTPMSIKVTGAVVEEVGSTNATPQPIKLINVASKTYKDASKAKRTSLGAIGSLPKVVNELQVGNTTSAPAEATPSSIQGSTLKAITVSGGPLVADEIVGAIDKVTVAGGNLRVGLIQSSKDLVLVQATAKKINGALVGGAVGTAGSATAMVVKAQPAANSKRVAITKVYGQAGVSGYFYAGYGASFQKGGIGILQTKSGQVEGAAFLDPTLVSKLKVLPKTPVQPIVINPQMQ